MFRYKYCALLNDGEKVIIFKEEGVELIGVKESNLIFDYEDKKGFKIAEIIYSKINKKEINKIITLREFLIDIPGLVSNNGDSEVCFSSKFLESFKAAVNSKNL